MFAAWKLTPVLRQKKSVSLVKSIKFCAVHCRDKFAQAPESYLVAESETAGSQRSDTMQPLSDNTEKSDFQISGMSCSSCVAKIENKFKQLTEVVDAQVNFASERATVELVINQITHQDVVEAIESLGYEVTESTLGDPVAKEEAARDTVLRKLRGKFLFGLLLVVPLFLLVHWDNLGLNNLLSLNQQNNFLLQFVIQTLFQFWVGWRFYRLIATSSAMLVATFGTPYLVWKVTHTLIQFTCSATF